MPTGVVKFFNESKGFGFVTGEDGKEIFLHVTGLSPGVSVRDGDRVTYEVTQGRKGPNATSVQKVA